MSKLAGITLPHKARESTRSLLLDPSSSPISLFPTAGAPSLLLKFMREYQPLPSGFLSKGLSKNAPDNDLKNAQALAVE